MLVNKLKSNRIIKSGFIAFAIWCMLACKKNNDENLPSNIFPTTGTRTEFTLDSIFLYTKEIYLWQDALPNVKGGLDRAIAGQDRNSQVIPLIKRHFKLKK